MENLIALPGDTIGIIGDSQNGIMLARAIKQMGFKVAAYCSSQSVPTLAEADVKISELLPAVQKQWNVFHIHCDGSHCYSFAETNWEELLGINAIVSSSRGGEDIAEIIPKLVLSCYNQRNVESIEE